MADISRCVQYGVWANCPNSCDFCLLKSKKFYNKSQQIFWLNNIIENVKVLDWKNEFSGGISLLGGELYYIKDHDVQNKFIELVDTTIEYILNVTDDPVCRYSTVTNGLYQPNFLYRVVDKLYNESGISKVDVNFSFDFKYRFKNDNSRKLCLKNINDFAERYQYKVGIQMILTQYVIDMWKSGSFDVNKWLETYAPNSNLSFLYPHKIMTGKQLFDFNFKRKDLLEFVRYLKSDCPSVYRAFVHSTLNSERFKLTGLISREKDDKLVDVEQKPKLADGKEIKASCGHSVLYRCYTDCNNCMLCDLQMIDGELY